MIWAINWIYTHSMCCWLTSLILDGKVIEVISQEMLTDM